MQIKARVEFRLIIMDYLQRRDGYAKSDPESKKLAACKGMRYLNVKRKQRGMGKVLINAVLGDKWLCGTPDGPDQEWQ